MKDEAATKIYQISRNAFEVVVDGIPVKATFNSYGAAQAAIEVERNRRAKKRKANQI